jgi:hypothetical protein
LKKIPTLFERDWEGDRSRVLPVVTAGCEWVLAGEGVATRKYDGTCMLFDGAHWYARREVKPGKLPPPGFVVVDADAETGKVFGWEPATQSPFAKFLHEALGVETTGEDRLWEPGTYELVGPKIQGNPEGYATHQLIGHAGAQVIVLPQELRTFKRLAAFFEGSGIEGIVFHHPDGRMAKIKQRDFGLQRA